MTTEIMAQVLTALQHQACVFTTKIPLLNYSLVMLVSSEIVRLSITSSF